MPDVATDDDIDAFHRDAAARRSVAFDHDESTVPRSGGAFAGEAFDAHAAGHDVLRRAPADVAVHDHIRLLVHPCGEVSGVAHDLDRDRGVQSDGNVVQSVGVLNLDPLHAVR